MTPSRARGAAKEGESMRSQERAVGESPGILLAEKGGGGLIHKTPRAGTTETDTQ